MSDTNGITPAEPENISFDGIEIVGLIIPLLFAVMAIVLVALTPDSAGTATNTLRPASQHEALTNLPLKPAPSTSVHSDLVR